MGYDFLLEIHKWDVLTNETMAPPCSHTSLAWFNTRDPNFMVYEIIPTYLGSISSPVYKQPCFFPLLKWWKPTYMEGWTNRGGWGGCPKKDPNENCVPIRGIFQFNMCARV